MNVIAGLVGALLALAGGLFIMVVQPGPSGVAGALRLADGSEYMVTQTCNWSAEPYTIEFFMKPAGGSWGWCYMDHEASRWWDVQLTHDPASDSVIITEQGVKRAVLDRKQSTFWIESFQRTQAAPQQLVPNPRYAFPLK